MILRGYRLKLLNPTDPVLIPEIIFTGGKAIEEERHNEVRVS